ncbi:MAG: 2OG-Fe(II) oxygenase family protein [Chlamydiota bacterium]|nr:2OG-Fe(II) oxygenase family protein [Chlamydiota bacterium]
MYKIIFSAFFYLILPVFGFGEPTDYSIQRSKTNQLHTAEEPLYYVVEAPLSIQQLWENAKPHFLKQETIKPHNDQWFSKWHQLKKFWSKDKNEVGHYERKESIVITSDDNNLEMMKACRLDLQEFCIQHLKRMEQDYNLPKHSLTMKNAIEPKHTLRLLHYLSGATAIAHYDTSIMTCLYYRDGGLQLKIGEEWIDAPKLKPNEMLVTYGVPGEILSNGHLKALRHRVRCDERYAIAYFHNTPKNYILESENYNQTTMAHVYQEAQLWYADVNARVVRRYCKSTQLPWYVVLYGWLAQRFEPVNLHHISRKDSVEKISLDSKQTDTN